ncbi:MAG: hypothetical protein E7439_04345 [Ruminococcaceae bacterium]|nr:hypothetical protein [Oscillospiraceae bacterium]
MTDMERLAKLYEIAEKDPIYLMWKHDFEANREDFCKFANGRKNSIRNFLYAYADAGRMMLQRLSLLACMHMEFPEEKDQGAL